MEQILDIHGNEIVLDINGDHIVEHATQSVLSVSELCVETPIKVKSDTKQRRSKQKITLEFITSILTDKYHNSMTVSEIKSKYGIGHDVYKFINSHSDIFITQFGKKKKIITPDELQEYWKNLKI